LLHRSKEDNGQERHGTRKARRTKINREYAWVNYKGREGEEERQDEREDHILGQKKGSKAPWASSSRPKERQSKVGSKERKTNIRICNYRHMDLRVEEGNRLLVDFQNIPTIGMVGRQTFFPQGATIGVRAPSSESRVKGVYEKKDQSVALPFRAVNSERTHHLHDCT